MADSGLYLVGTIHNDIDGERRLEDLLERLSPDVIALEYHKDRVHNTSQEFEEARKKLTQSLSESQIHVPESFYQILFHPSIKDAMGFELRTSLKYTQKHSSTKLEFIDMPIGNLDQLTEGMISHIEQVVSSPEILQKVVLEFEKAANDPLTYIRQIISNDYDNSTISIQIRELFNSLDYLEVLSPVMNPEQIEAFRLAYDEKRDILMAEQIRNHCNESITLVGIVGVIHLPGIASELHDIGRNVFTLKQYAQIHDLD